MADSSSGFCPQTKTYKSLRPQITLPLKTSLPSYIFALLKTSPKTISSSLINATTKAQIPISSLHTLVTKLASKLQHKYHISKNDVALIVSPNSIHLPILYLSLLSIGAIVSPTYPLSTHPELARLIKLVKPVVIFADIAFKFREKFREKFKTVIVNDTLIFDVFEDEELDDCVGVDISENDTAAILFSSGTTGRVKGVELTHGNFIGAIAGVYAGGGGGSREFGKVTLCVVPFFHVYGFVLCLREIAMGGSVVVVKGGSLEVILKGVREFEVTHLAVAPPSVVRMVKGECDDLGSLEAVLCGGAPLARSVIERFRVKFANVSLMQAYGLTETTAGVTRSLGPSESKVVGGNGRLMSNCEAKIVDPVTGDGLPPLRPGELWIRGPTVMKAYVGDEEATSAILDSEGWLRTGDICYFDNEGFLLYVERMKELIKYNGYQVSPAELEDLLLSHPDIVDAAVIPYPDEDAGQVPVAFVVKHPGSTVTDSHIMDFVSRQVAPYKRIRRIIYVDSIPKNAPGKVLRKELVNMLASSITSKL